MHIPVVEQSAGAFSRRGLLKSAATLAAAGAIAAPAESDDTDRRPNKPIRAYVGTYTNHGEGIYLFEMNRNTGALTQVNVFKTSNPSWLAFHPSRKFLYAANEDSPGNVTAFAVDAATGNLTEMNMASSGGSGPAHISVHPSGKYVFSANYGSGNVAVIRVLANGLLGPITDNKDDATACTPACQLGPMNAQNAPPGSFAISGHDAAHAHMIHSDPMGNFVLVNDLGLDLTIVWKFDAASGTLSNPKTFPASPGAGPRHFVFHPNGRYFYSINEEASTMAFKLYDAKSGSLTQVQEISTLPPGFTGTNFTSEVVISADGRYVYGANRLHDSIAVMAVEPSGMLDWVTEEWTRGDYPRNIAIDPTGNFMFSCNHRGDNITSYRIDGNGRRLRFTGEYTPVGSPAIILFP